MFEASCRKQMKLVLQFHSRLIANSIAGFYITLKNLLRFIRITKSTKKYLKKKEDSQELSDEEKRKLRPSKHEK